jgi:hypothetical protein
VKKKRPIVLQFLFDRHLARRFAQRVEEMAAGCVPMLVQSLLSAALIVPCKTSPEIRFLESPDFDAARLDKAAGNFHSLQGRC